MAGGSGLECLLSFSFVFHGDDVLMGFIYLVDTREFHHKRGSSSAALTAFTRPDIASGAQRYGSGNGRLLFNSEELSPGIF